GNRRFRYFISCDNGNLYGYDLSGQPLPGWNPRKKAGAITHRLLHFEFDGKDYLVTANKKGVLHLMDRRGYDRVPPINLNTTFTSQPVYDPFSNHVVLSDTGGNVYEVTLDGKYKISSYKKGAFSCFDVNGDNSYDYIFKTATHIEVLSQDSDLILKYQLPVTIDGAVFPVVIPLTNSIWMGMVSGPSNQLYLVNEKGILYEDFPLEGSSKFLVVNLFQDERRVLVAYNVSDVMVYEIK
ncbi:MAG: hypothetical protein IH946_10750, partial [Bacteroidetes bacterium]|nr:hypothetical protein [Bacteroidota bacterium]